MKKIKAFGLVTIIVIALVSSILTNKPILVNNNDNQIEKTLDADLTFAVFGDVHENVNHFQEAIDDFYTINPELDALILNGDSVDQGLDKQYDSMKKALNKNKDLLPEIIIKNIGNHEFFDYDIETNSKEQVQGFINKYLDFAEVEKVYHDKWINGYHFISLGSEDGNSETMDSVTAFLSSEQIQWFKEKLAEKYEKGKPIFVFLHQQLEYPNSSWIGVEQADEIRDILSEYPEVILFSSHTHRDLNENSVALNKPFTIVHTGAIHYTLVYDSTKEKGLRREEDYINGIYVEVNGNNVKIKGRDIKEKEWKFNIDVEK